jgi:hypothetical protein
MAKTYKLGQHTPKRATLNTLFQSKVGLTRLRVQLSGRVLAQYACKAMGLIPSTTH